MALSVFPAASGGKTRYAVSLTSGTSWTVPAGVTYVNVTLIGGGGGSGMATAQGVTVVQGGTGGTTTFTGATSAVGGGGGGSVSNGFGSGSGGYGRGGVAATANSGLGAVGAQLHSNASSSGQPISEIYGGDGQDGAVVTSTVNTTPGASISYAIGAGGVAGSGGSGPTGNGATGGSGRIDIEYWV